MPKAIDLKLSQYNQQHLSNQTANVTGSLFLKLTLLSVIFLPFTKALTVSIGFPLKCYEILLPIAALILFLNGKISGGKDIERLILLSIGFLIVALISTLMGQFDDSANIALNYRGSKFVDSMSRAAYLLFNIISMIVAYHSTTRSPLRILKFWFIGLSISFSYHLITVIFFLLIGEAPLLPGLERHQTGWVGSYLIPRSGTFEEGNFAGLYYLASLALAVYAGNRYMMLIAAAGILLTLSTSTYLASAVFLMVLGIMQKELTFGNIVRIILIVSLMFFLVIELDFVSKFGENSSSSGAVRLNEAITGVRIFLAHPFLGVGLGGYGYHFDAFEWDFALSIFYGSEKHIANNIYVELLSETGIMGFLLYSLFFFGWFVAIRNGNRKSICFSAFHFGVLVVFFAYPTFNITYIWFFIGLTTALTQTVVNNRANQS